MFRILFLNYDYIFEIFFIVHHYSLNDKSYENFGLVTLLATQTLKYANVGTLLRRLKRSSNVGFNRTRESEVLPEHGTVPVYIDATGVDCSHGRLENGSQGGGGGVSL